MAFDAGELMAHLMRQLTANEVNNIVYMLLKHALKIDDPSNEDIASIMSVVVNKSTPDMIIDSTVDYVRTKYGQDAIGNDPARLDRHMYFIIEEFMKLPYNLRNDLGTDSGVKEFLTK